MHPPLDLWAHDLVVVGSGFYELTVAECCASELGRRVLVHRYGAHLFHTSNDRVWSYVNRFTGYLEEKAISLIGRPLYEAFVRGYTAWLTRMADHPAAAETDVLFGGPPRDLPVPGHAHGYCRRAHVVGQRIDAALSHRRTRAGVRPPQMPRRLVHGSPTRDSIVVARQQSGV